MDLDIPKIAAGLSCEEYCVIAEISGVSTYYMGGRGPGTKRGGTKQFIQAHMTANSSIIEAAVDSLVAKGVLHPINSGLLLLVPEATAIQRHVETNPRVGPLRILLNNLAQNYTKPGEPINVAGINAILHLGYHFGLYKALIDKNLIGKIEVPAGTPSYAICMSQDTIDMLSRWKRKETPWWRKIFNFLFGPIKKGFELSITHGTFILLMYLAALLATVVLPVWLLTPKHIPPTSQQSATVPHQP